MKNIISDVQAFPVDAQSNLFFCAWSSVLLKALGYTEDTPFFCGQHRRICVQCGNCANKTTMMKHHLQLYHLYQTVSAAGLGWEWPENYDFEYMMNIAGLQYQRLSRSDGTDAIFAALVKSIDAGLPALMKLGDGPDWHVVTGYGDEGTLYGLDAHRHFAKPQAVLSEGYTKDGLFMIRNWFEPLAEVIVITGETAPSIGLTDMIRRMIAQLALPENGALEADILWRIDTVSPDNATELAEQINRLAGFAAEARWHAAECFGASLVLMTDDAQMKEQLYVITDRYLHTHDLCWEIWGRLGVGPKTNYALSPQSGERILQKKIKADLQRLISSVFENDRAVLGLLRGIVDQPASESPA